MSQITIRRAPESNLLVSLTDVKSILGISGSTQDAILTQYITEASSLIETFCGRKLGRALYTEKKGVPLGGMGEMGQHRMMLSCLPIMHLGEIRYYDEAIENDDVEVEDSNTGFLFSEEGFVSTSMLVQHIEVSDTGANSPKWEIDYTAGYILSTFPTVSKTLTNDSFNVTTGVITSPSAHNLVPGDTVRFTPATAEDTLASCFAQYRDYFVLTTPSATTFTVTDEIGGEALTLTADGTGNTTMTREVNLPAAISGAAFELVTSRYRSRGRDKSIVSESLADHSVTYSADPMPKEIMGMLSPFRKID